MASTPKWIMDGNYSRTLARRLACCDRVFFLDYPVEVCLAGSAARIGRIREDLPWVEREFDPEFRQWIEEFPQTQLPQIYALLAQYGHGREIIIFHSREDSAAWLERHGSLSST